MKNLLEIKELSIFYGTNKVVDKVSFSLKNSDILGIYGASGSGKSSLLKAIAGLLPISSGNILFNGVEFNNYEPFMRKFVLMFQDNQLIPTKTVGGNIFFACKCAKMCSKDAKKMIKELLELVGLQGYENRKISTLSGGQEQRVALARVLATNPNLVLLDEPFSALDKELADFLAIEVKRLLNQRNIPAIFVSHNLEHLKLIATNILKL